MRVFILVLLSVLFVSKQSFAVKWAETADNYYVIVGLTGFECDSCDDDDEDASRLLVINKRTNAEQSIRIGHPKKRHDPSAIAIKGDKAYITFKHSNSLGIVNLTTLTLERTIKRICDNPKDIEIVDDLAFIKDSSQGRIVFDLNTQSVTQTPGAFNVHKLRQDGDIKIQGNHSFILQNGIIYLFDLSTNKLIATTGHDHKFKKFFLVNDHAVALTENSTLYEIDTTSLDTTKRLSLHDEGYQADTFHVQGNLGYLYKTSTTRNVECKVIDLNTYTVLGTGFVPSESTTFRVKSNGKKGKFFSLSCTTPDFYTDAFAYENGNRLFPLFPTLTSLSNSSITQIACDLKAMRPKAFTIDNVKPRAYPTQETDLDLLPPYVLAQNVFWNNDSGLPIIDPVDILANLTTMMYPQRFLQTEAGQWLRPRLHLAFFQTIWLGHTEKAQAMLKYFIQLDDPVITKLTKSILINVPGYEDVMQENNVATSSTSTNSTSK